MLPSRIYGAMSTPVNCFFDRDGYYIPHGELALVKDHRYRDKYKSDRTIYVVRDGRDSILSYAYMNFKANQHKFYQRGELAEYIQFNKRTCPYGDWASNVNEALAAKRSGAEVKIVHYDQVLNRPAALLELASFFAPNLALAVEDASNAMDDANEKMTSLKKNPRWGFEDTVPAESYFYEWSRNRGGSNWATAFDSEAKRVFHETGATELLMELGFESDPDWWRN